MKAIWNLISKFEDDGTLNAKWGTKGFAAFEEIRAAAEEARAMENHVRAAKAECANLLGLLRELEWRGYDDWGVYCIVCGNYKDGVSGKDGYPAETHAVNCRLAAALDRKRA